MMLFCGIQVYRLCRWSFSPHAGVVPNARIQTDLQQPLQSRLARQSRSFLYGNEKQ